MSFTGFLTTEKGKNLLTKLLSGEKLVFTRVSAGSGVCLDEEIAQNLSDLICPEMEGTSTVPSFLDGVVGLTVEFRSDMVSGSGFSLSEYGIFALDPDEGEILLYYATLGESPQFLTGDGGHYGTVLRFDVSIAISDDFQGGIGLTYPASSFVRYEEMEQAFLEHNEDLSAHEGLFGAIVDELESLETSFGNSLEELETSLGKDLEKLESSFGKDLEELESSFGKDLEELESSLEKDLEKLETSLEEMGTKEHVHDTSDLTSGVLGLNRGGLGNTNGRAVTADSLTNGRNLSVNLASTSVSSFNGTANATLGVSGVLPVANGGTGASSAEGVKTALGITSLVGVTNNNTNVAGQNGQTSLGVDANASGTGSVALGKSAIASGNYGIALGNSAVSGTFGDDTLEYAVAIGYKSGATGDSAVALGVQAKATNVDSVTLGNFASTTGAYAMAFGTAASSSGEGSLALGWYSKAQNSYATALGSETAASGQYSTALGHSATTTSNESNYIQLGGEKYTSVLRSPVSLTVSSDMRDKTDIVPVSDSLEFLSKIQPMGYVMNYRRDYEEDFSEELEILEEKEKKISENLENTENLSKTGKEDSQLETLSLEEENRLNALKERKRKRNTYGRGDYDRESHKKGEKKGKRRRIGVLAQEVQQAMLDQYGTDNYADLVIDNLYEVEDVPEGMESSLGVNYSNFIPFLIDGVNRLHRENQRLSQENQEILERISLLEGCLD